MSRPLSLSLLISGLVLPAVILAQTSPTGYDDTPMQPNGRWRVHDGRRPQPPIVTAAPIGDSRVPPPSDAIVLLGAGGDLAAWQMTGGGAAAWTMADGVLLT